MLINRTAPYSGRPLMLGIVVARVSPNFFLLGLLFLNQFVRDVVFIDVGDVGHRLFTDPFPGNDLDVIEPDVGIEPTLLSFLLKLLDTTRSCVVGRELIKGGMVLADSVSEFASETSEKFKDLLAEAKSEMETSKAQATNKTASGNVTKG